MANADLALAVMVPLALLQLFMPNVIPTPLVLNTLCFISSLPLPLPRT
jgi:hypothetical protein